MIVEPTPTNPRSPMRRALRLVGIVLPVVLFAGFLGAGLLGPKPEPVAPDASLSPVIADASLVPAVPDPSAAPAAVILPSGPGPGFPTVAAGLNVLSVPEAQTALATGQGHPLAVAGYLDGLRTADACPASAGDTRGLLSPLCERRVRLVVASAGATNPGAHLHVRMPPGVRLPAAFEDATPDAPMQVVIVGRGEVPGAPCWVAARGCGEQMTADLVAWADGGPFNPGPVFDAGLEVPPPAIGYRHLHEALSLVAGPSGTILISAVVRPATVAAIDPDAGAALAAKREPEGLVWYVRGLVTDYGPGRYPVGDYPPRIQWALVDETTGDPLATGVLTPLDDTETSPAAVANMRVRSVSATLDAWHAGRGAAVVAVTGYLRAALIADGCSPGTGLPGADCRRRVVLAETAGANDGAGGFGGFGSHIHATVLPGVLLPGDAGGPAAGGGTPRLVAIIGRFGASNAACPGDLLGCEDSFVIERVAWSDGASVALEPGVESGLVAEPADPMVADTSETAGTALGPATELLNVLLVRPAGLSLVDPMAAVALDAKGFTEAAWYVRGVDVPHQPLPDPPYGRLAPVIRWAVVSVRGNVVVSGEVTGPPALMQANLTN
jgi:hypothetical protein